MKVTTHYDKNGKEWVLRLEKPNGDFVSLGGLVAKEEADLVRDVLQGALELDSCCQTATDEPSVGFRRGMANANNMVEGRRIREFF
jgi:hypothetical protein